MHAPGVQPQVHCRALAKSWASGVNGCDDASLLVCASVLPALEGPGGEWGARCCRNWGAANVGGCSWADTGSRRVQAAGPLLEPSDVSLTALRFSSCYSDPVAASALDLKGRFCQPGFPGDITGAKQAGGSNAAPAAAARSHLSRWGADVLAELGAGDWCGTERSRSLPSPTEQSHEHLQTAQLLHNQPMAANSRCSRQKLRLLAAHRLGETNGPSTSVSSLRPRQGWMLQRGSTESDISSDAYSLQFPCHLVHTLHGFIDLYDFIDLYLTPLSRLLSKLNSPRLFSLSCKTLLCPGV